MDPFTFLLEKPKLEKQAKSLHQPISITNESFAPVVLLYFVEWFN